MVRRVPRLAGSCEWSVSPFYGRLLRRSWDRNGNLLVAAAPPEGYPDGHLKPVLVDLDGESARLEGRAVGSVIEVVMNHDEGWLSFCLDGGAEGPRLEGFPLGDGGGTPLRPVLGLRWEEDQVTIRSSSSRLHRGWPHHLDNATREKDARGLAAARELLGLVARMRSGS